MGVLQISPDEDFLNFVGYHYDVGMTGGKYFLGMMEDRTKLIEEIEDIVMCDEIRDGIGRCIERVLHHKPGVITGYRFQEADRECIAYDVLMPIEANVARCKQIHITLKPKV